MGDAKQSAVLTTALWHFMEQNVGVRMGHVAGDLESSERRSLHALPADSLPSEPPGKPAWVLVYP